MSSQRRIVVPITDVASVVDQIAAIQIAATCARLILAGIQSLEASSNPYDPLYSFLLRLEGDIDALASSAGALQQGGEP